MAKSSSTRYVILGLLSSESMSGYDIKKLVDSTLGHFWSESYGRLYPTLKKLEAEGLTKSKVEKGTRKPDRIVYQITAAGLKELKQWLGKPAALPWVRVEILLKLFFAHNLPPAASIHLLEDQRRALANRLELFDGFDRMVEEGEYDPDMERLYRLTILHGRMVYDARIRWCDEALKLMRSKKRRKKKETSS
jgi:DNA-binding PadR family transcriptional regulator